MESFNEMMTSRFFSPLNVSWYLSHGVVSCIYRQMLTLLMSFGELNVREQPLRVASRITFMCCLQVFLLGETSEKNLQEMPSHITFTC